MGLWTKKPLKELLQNSNTYGHKLKRSLTTSDLIFLGIGAVIGAGLFSITGIAAAENAGPAIILSFIFAAVGCCFAAMCYSELATMIPISGSAYTYAHVAMGELPAWIIGWSLILEYALGAATVSISWSAYVVALFDNFNIHLPAALTSSAWQRVVLLDGTTISGIINLPAVLIVVIISGLLIVGMRQSAVFNTLIVIIKITAVCIFVLFGVFFINPDNYIPFIPKNTGTFGEFGWSGIFRGTSVVFFAFIGFDALSTTTMEVKNPQKSIPIGILGSLSICTVIYVIFCLVLTGLANYKELDVAAPVAAAIAKTPFPWLKWVVEIAILTGLTSVILMMLLGQSRIFYIMSCDGLLPKYFSALHPTLFTPWRSNLVVMVLVSLIAAFTPISIVGHMSSIGTLLAFTMVCLVVIILRYRHPEYPRPFRVPAFPYIPLLGVVTCFSMMLFLEWESWVRLIIWMAIGMGIYIAQKRRSLT